MCSTPLIYVRSVCAVERQSIIRRGKNDFFYFVLCWMANLILVSAAYLLQCFAAATTTCASAVSFSHPYTYFIGQLNWLTVALYRIELLVCVWYAGDSVHGMIVDRVVQHNTIYLRLFHQRGNHEFFICSIRSNVEKSIKSTIMDWLFWPNPSNSVYFVLEVDFWGFRGMHQSPLP